MKRIISVAILAGALVSASGQNTIVYVSGPSFPVPPEYSVREVDLNNDGVPDLVFSSSGPISTADVPPSGMWWPFGIGATGSNAFLTSYCAFMQPFGEPIAGIPPTGSAWSAPRRGGLLTGFYSIRNGGVVRQGWEGTLGALGVGYLGVRFYAADGLHYGWIRARLPRPDPGPQGFPMEFAPVIVDWAWEARPNTPLAAGVVGSSTRAMQFTVEFLDRDARSHRLAQQPGSGTFLLTGSSLRGEITLNGRFSSVIIGGPAFSPARTKPIARMGDPLVSRSDHTAFFCEAALTPAQITQLRHGAYYVVIDNGIVAGRILPEPGEHRY